MLAWQRVAERVFPDAAEGGMERRAAVEIVEPTVAFKGASGEELRFSMAKVRDEIPGGEVYFIVAAAQDALREGGRLPEP